MVGQSKMEDLELERYKGKKVLITGHTGFKGTWFMLMLHKLGAQVYGLSLKPESKSLYLQINGDQFCKNHELDIRDADSLSKKIVEIQPDYIFHLAAQSLVIDGYEDPKYTYETNVMGTLNLLEAVRKLDTCNVVVITTDKVYENPENGIPFKESDKLGGYDPYSSSKACSEILTSSYRRSFFKDSEVKIVTARAGNVIGGGDFSKDRIIPDIIRAIENKEPIELRSPNSTRPWQHVLDALFGYLKLGLHLNKSNQLDYHEWNFGPNAEDPISVLQLAEMSLRLLDRGKIHINENSNLHEASFLGLDSSLANKELNWSPVLNGKASIELTLNWYQLFSEKHLTAVQITELQIENFLGSIEK